ncbi:helix-turn-helix domain-containing protein [Lacticaseibacillus parakribbianus]|uniref:helix-turn-helix domain-containing protein n=1 Tax=Lacticaseibacillus parakribbianus TaxID=2970927 RepID=UPI0021CB1439|nr:helix-turn-helix transcriptional regulator [Lacticaseibacillus parakribbianus]
MKTMGDFFKQIREARHVPLTAVAGVRSPASVSRWENNQIEVTSDIIGDALTPLGVDFGDLTIRHFVADVHDHAWAAIAPETWDRAAVCGLRESFAAQRESGNDTPYTRFVVALLDELIRIHDENAQQLSPHITKLISDYTAGLTSYGSAEGVLIEAAVEFTSAAVSVTWMRPLYDSVMGRPGEATLHLKQRLLAFGGTVANSAALSAEFDIMKQTLAMMATVLATMPDNPIGAYNYHVMARLYDYMQDKTAANRAALVAVINTTKVIYPTGYFASFSQYAIAQGWLTAADFAAAPV